MEIGFAFSNSNNIPQVVAGEIRKFFDNTFIGLESSLYKTTENKDSLIRKESRYHITSMAIQYLNIVYKSLIL